MSEKLYRQLADKNNSLFTVSNTLPINNVSHGQINPSIEKKRPNPAINVAIPNSNERRAATIRVSALPNNNDDGLSQNLLS